MYKVEGEERAKVYDRLTALLPPPAPVNRDAALRLDGRTLETWKETIRADILQRDMAEMMPSD